MKSVFYSVLCLLMLASCKQEEPATTVATVTPAASETAATTNACPPAAFGYQFLPEGLDVPVVYHLRADRFYTAKDGRLRRRVALEFLEGDADSVRASVEEAMVKAGYKSRPSKTLKNNDIHTPYVKKGVPNIAVMINAEAGESPHHPDAKGVLVYDYPMAVAAPPPVSERE